MSFYTFSNSFRGAPDGWTSLLKGNFLVGENSTGKSSFIKLLKIVVSTDFQVRSLVYLRDRPDYNFDDFRSKMSNEENNHFSVGCAGYKEVAEGITGKLVTYLDNDGTPKLKHMSFIFGNSLIRLSGFEDVPKMYERKIRSDAKTNTLLSKFSEFHLKDENTLGDPIELPTERKSLDSDERNSVALSVDFDRGVSKSLPYIPDFVDNVDHLGPIRTRPGHVYYVGGESKSTQGEESLDKLAKDNQPILEACNRFGKRSGLFDEMHVKTLTDLGPNNIVINFERAGKVFFAEELGYGVGQIVPILIEATRPRNQTILIAEQPELHLHPRAQAAFGSLMADFLSAGHKFLIETHSDFIIDRFRLELNKRRRNHREQSQVLFFRTSGGTNKLAHIPINSEGGFEDQPSSYRKFFRKETFDKLSIL